MNALKATQAYMNVELEGSTNSASAHRLITMLFEGAIAAIIKAKICNESGDIAGRGKSISFALNIIGNGLKAGLNLEEGGEIARNLQALYDYMSFRLIEANLQSSTSILSEVEGLLREIKGAWDMIGSSPVKPAIMHEPRSSLAQL
jgi:flagellar protein FliS